MLSGSGWKDHALLEGASSNHKQWVAAERKHHALLGGVNSERKQWLTANWKYHALLEGVNSTANRESPQKEITKPFRSRQIQLANSEWFAKEITKKPFRATVVYKADRT